jgi:hypothetical protein
MHKALSLIPNTTGGKKAKENEDSELFDAKNKGKRGEELRFQT